jgi:diguanylate cyclase (GGDEF)-like protein/PAS domain S-box-containing protein
LLLNRPEVILVSQLGFTAWYPATGLAMALLLAVSPRYAFLVGFAGWLAEVVVYHEPLTAKSAAIAPLAGVVFYAAAAYLLRGPLRIDLRLRHRRDVVRYLFVTLTAAAGSTAVGVLCLVADHEITWKQFWPSAIGWFAGDGIGLLGVAPFLLIHVLPWVRKHVSGVQPNLGGRIGKRPKKQTAPRLGALAEVMGQAASIVAVLWVMFGKPLGSMQLYYVAYVPIIWIAMRHGIRRAVTGLLAINFGIVVALHIFLPAAPAVLKIGLLMLMVSGTGLILGSAVSERHRIARELREQTVYMNSLIENSPIGIVVLDPDGTVRLCNEAFEKLFEFQRDEIVGQNLDRLILPPERAAEEAREIAELTFGGKCVQKHVRRMRRDGVHVDVELNAVPLIIEGRVRGIYRMYKDISDQVHARKVADENAESQARMVSELQLRTGQFVLLHEMGDLLQCCATSQEAYAVAGMCCKKLFPEATAGTIYVFKSSRSALDAVANWGQTSASESSFSPDACWGLRRGRLNWSEVPEGTVKCPHLKEPDAGSYLCVPMLAQNDMIGMLHLQYDLCAKATSAPGFESLQQSQQRLAATVAGQIAMLLASLRLRDSLRDQSIRDPLTGLFNRRFMQESLDRELHRARRKNRSLAVLFLDVDHFKRFNDTYGHEAGDFVLRSFADLFRRHFRNDDVICRYGGEEFAVILPESSSSDAAKRAATLRAAVKKIGLRYRGQPLDQVTFSIGIAAFPEHGQTGEELLRAADQCLYQSKAEGRDRVTVAVG